MDNDEAYDPIRQNASERLRPSLLSVGPKVQAARTNFPSVQKPGGKINLVFLGRFPYPRGMAGTKRIQHAVDALRANAEVMIRVIVLYQVAAQDRMRGVHNGVPYETILSNLYGSKKAVLLPLLHARTVLALRRAWQPGCKNILYNYGPAAVDNIISLRIAKRMGYQIILDIVEDYDTAKSISDTFLGRLNVSFINWVSGQTGRIASGMVIINRHLEKKYSALSRQGISIHHRPISVDMSRFAAEPNKMEETISLFYAGSFGKKDGLPVLMDAFDKLAGTRKDLRLVLTGQGREEDVQRFFARAKASAFTDRIEYKGYLDDDTYYAVLQSCDIPCMTRTDLDYAHAGFPFKLGEYLATGKPVIASRVSEIDRYLKDRKSALLVKPGDSQAIAAAVEFLIDNPEEACIIGQRGREIARTCFDYRSQGESLLSFMKNL